MTGRREIRCEVDGRDLTVTVPVRASLAEFLSRNGAHVGVGCETGACGVCLVRLDEQLVRSCTMLAVQADGTTVHTARDAELADVRHAMSIHSAVQCGYCGPAFALTIGELTDPTSVRADLCEVTCRCTGYTGLTAAAAMVATGCAGCTPAEPLRRNEDARLLSGRGEFVGARNLPGQLAARFVRSTHAHAGIVAVHSVAAESPGVVAVLTAADLPPTTAYLPGAAEPTLAVDEVRYVGQPIAVVLAESAEVAEDAAELVAVEYAPRTPLLTPDGPARPLPVFERAEVVLDERFTVPRRTGMPMEPRGVLAAWGEDGLTVWSSTEHPQQNRDVLAKALDLAVDEIRLAPGDVGGAFGGLYPEDIVVPYAATRLRRPVKWIEDRDEHLVSISH
ncbi:MAG TPA: molybdopterin cofactor-binding domain-containing protein, partial [Actinophytocola sp.]|nr:molybdopterin cofactor-binding domain-containing protein [Actinophytocola sp.]